MSIDVGISDVDFASTLMLLKIIGERIAYVTSN